MSNPPKQNKEGISHFFADKKEKFKAKIDVFKQKSKEKKEKLINFFHPHHAENKLQESQKSAQKLNQEEIKFANPAVVQGHEEEKKLCMPSAPNLPSSVISNASEPHTFVENDILMCPISQEIMTDPVMTPYGHCFQRECIESWLSTHTTCPLTNKPLSKEQLVPSYTVKAIVEQYMKSNGLAN